MSCLPVDYLLALLTVAEYDMLLTALF